MPPQRHIHAQDLPKVRQRSSKACLPCRKRKIKCDGDLPCAACVGYGYECAYADKIGQPTKSFPATSPARTASVNESTQIIQAPDVTDDTLLKKPEVEYLSNEILVHPECWDNFLHQPLKTRFTSVHSAIAHPKILGTLLGLENPPRLQSFGWNPSIRPEPVVRIPNTICNIITLEEMQQYSGVYFNEFHPFFGILDKESFKTRANEFWTQNVRGTDFEACVCGVVALGSLFSGPGSSLVEDQVTEHGRLLLELSFSSAPALLSIKHVVAWNLRAIYLRLTTRPHLSWMASCTAVHIAESIGLHREISDATCLLFTQKSQRVSVDVAEPTEPRREIIDDGLVCQHPRQFSQLEDFRRRTFWVSMALNQLFASEYGRSRVQIDAIGTKPHEQKSGDFTAETIAIMQSVPKSQQLCSISNLLEALRKTTQLPAKLPFLALLRADATFCLFRTLGSTNMILPPDLAESVLEVTRVALDGVTFLCSMNHPWWNIIYTPFHSVCILLAMATPQSFAMIPTALDTLKNAVSNYPSHLSNEALKTAHALVKGARDKRAKELNSLDRGLTVVGEVDLTHFSSNGSGNGIPNMNGLMDGKDGSFDWPMDGDHGFVDFFDLGQYGGLDAQNPF